MVVASKNSFKEGFHGGEELREEDGAKPGVVRVDDDATRVDLSNDMRTSKHVSAMERYTQGS